MPRAIHHVGLSVADLGLISSFYKRAFGFEVRPGSEQAADSSWRAGSFAGSDTVALTAPNLLLALSKTDIAARPALRPVYARGITHVCVQAPQMAALANSVSEAGGSFHASPTDLGGEILYAYPRDPEGNVIELESIPQASREAKPWVGHVSFTTGDIERLVMFYEALVGGAARRSPKLGPNPKIDRLTGLREVSVTGAWLTLANMQLEFWQYHHPATVADGAAAGYSRVAFEIDGAAQVAEIGARVGATFTEAPLVNGARSFFGRDPDGNSIVLVAPTDGAASVSSLCDPDVVARVEAARQGAVA